MNKTTTLAICFAALALTPVFGQSTPKTPRELLEKAHYAEEHEHDLAAAERGFREAQAAAEKAGDAALARDAAAALENVLVRQGLKVAAQGEQLPDALVRLLAEGEGVSNPIAENGWLGDIALYGAQAVPVLAKMLGQPRDSDVKVGNRSITVYPELAARALCRIDTPESKAALLATLRSSDPVLRRAIVADARVEAHVELLLVGADDPAQAVRRMAVDKLVRCEDRRAADIAVREARAGDGNAWVWLQRFAPRRALELLDSGEVTLATNGLAGSTGLSSSDLEYFAERSLRASSGTVRKLATECAAQIVTSQRLGDTAPVTAQFTPEFEARLLNVCVLTRHPALISALEFAQPRKVLGVVLQIAGALAERPSGALLYALTSSLTRWGPAADITPSEYAAAYTALAKHADWTDERSVSALVDFARFVADASNASNQPTAFVELAQHIGPDERKRLSDTARDWAAQVLRVRGAQLPPSESFPESFRVVADWLLASRGPSHADRGLALLAGTGERKLLERALDTLAAIPELNVNSSTLLEVVKRAASAAPEQALAEFWKRIAASKGNPDASALVPRLTYSAMTLPLEQRIELMRRAWAEKLPDDVRASLCDGFLQSFHASQTSTPDAALALLLECYPGLPENASETRRQVISELVEALYEPAVPLLGEALRDRDVRVRTEAQNAFQKFRVQREALEEFQKWTHATNEERESIEALEKLLESNVRDVVLGAVKSLAAVRARRALPKLVRLLARDDAELRAAVQAAIDRIGQ
ncbi:MAG: HEAT repeat domain-containing protein [Planctomycetes bacterium]|nr:HEAT repeat domain-containing protein [Planctomycetota bacterium]